MPEQPDLDLDALAAELAATAATRRADGTYPPSIDEELRQEFETRLQHLTENLPATSLRAAQHNAQVAGQFELRPYGGESRLKSLASKAVWKATAFLLVDVVGQLNSYRAAVDRVFDGLIDAVEPQTSAVQNELLELRARLARLEQLAERESELAVQQRLDELERRVDRRGFSPWFDGKQFEEHFRGSEDAFLERYRPIVHRFAGTSGPVLDFGCGRGEVMAMLRDQGVQTIGVDLDPDAVEEAKSLGLDAVCADAIEHLASLPDESLGGLVCIQVVEHIGPQGVLDFVQLAHRKMAPGAQLFVETVNPQSLSVFANAMYADPTHTQPIHPEYLEFLFQQAGFAEVGVEYRSAVPEEQQLPTTDDESDLGRTVAEMTRRLNGLLYGPQDYAIVGAR